MSAQKGIKVSSLNEQEGQGYVVAFHLLHGETIVCFREDQKQAREDVLIARAHFRSGEPVIFVSDEGEGRMRTSIIVQSHEITSIVIQDDDGKGAEALNDEYIIAEMPQGL